MRAAILLAAGEGRRFGRSPKPLAKRDRYTLLAHALRIARQAPVARLIVVTGRQHGRVAAAARAADPRVRIVRAMAWRDGLDASLAAGLAALWPIEDAAFVFLADMPDVPPRLAAGLLRRCPPGGNARPAHRGLPGHPVLLGRDALAAGGAGRQRGGMTLVPADRRCRLDLDHRRDLRRRAPALMR